MVNDEILKIASNWRHTVYKWGGDSHAGIDCSHFVWEVLKAAGHPGAPYLTTHGIPGSHVYSHVTSPQDGDIILFDGHMGLVIDATHKIFVGAQSHGVDEASYAPGAYWGKRSHTFYRYTGH